MPFPGLPGDQASSDTYVQTKYNMHKIKKKLCSCSLALGPTCVLFVPLFCFVSKQGLELTL